MKRSNAAVKPLNIVKANRMLEEAKQILDEEEGGDGNSGQEDEQDTGAIDGDDDDIEGEVGDEDSTEDDKAGESDDRGGAFDQALAGGMDQAVDLVKKAVGESVVKALTASYGKSKKGMMGEYNKMSFRDMGTLADKFEDFANKVAEKVDLKGIVYEAMGSMVRQKG